jgi:hypothetical protein
MEDFQKILPLFFWSKRCIWRPTTATTRPTALSKTYQPQRERGKKMGSVYQYYRHENTLRWYCGRKAHCSRHVNTVPPTWPAMFAGIAPAADQFSHRVYTIHVRLMIRRLCCWYAAVSWFRVFCSHFSFVRLQNQTNSIFHLYCKPDFDQSIRPHTHIYHPTQTLYNCRYQQPVNDISILHAQVEALPMTGQWNSLAQMWKKTTVGCRPRWRRKIQRLLPSIINRFPSLKRGRMKEAIWSSASMRQSANRQGTAYSTSIRLKL